MIKSANSGRARYPPSLKARPELVLRSHVSIYVLLPYRKRRFVRSEDRTNLCADDTSSAKTGSDILISQGRGGLG